MNDIEEVKNRVNIVDIVGEKVRLKKSGVNYFGLCPFHGEKTPSFSVNETLQIYKCFGCGEGGNAYNFIMKTQNVDFREALEILAERVGYKLSNKYEKNSVSQDEVKKLLELNNFVRSVYTRNLLKDKDNSGILYSQKRHISEDLIKKFGLGYAPNGNQFLREKLHKNGYQDEYLIKSGICVRKDNGIIKDKFVDRLVFSVFDTKGQNTGFTGRYIGNASKDIAPPKYLNSPETLLFQKSKILFGLYQAQEFIKKYNFAIVSEGQMNILSSYRVGVKNIVASLGTSFTIDHIRLLKRYTHNIYLAFDKDTAGKKAMLRTLEMIWKNFEEVNVKIIYWDNANGKDPDEIINIDKNLWIEAINNPMDPIDYIIFEFNKRNVGEEKVLSFIDLCRKLISNIPDELKKENYYKKLSTEFGYSLEAIKGSLRTQSKNQPKVEVQKNSINSKFKENPVDSFFAIYLQFRDKLKKISEVIDREFIETDYLFLYDLIEGSEGQDIIEKINLLEESKKEFVNDLMLKPLYLDEKVIPKMHISKMIQGLLMYRYKALINSRDDKDHIIAERIKENILKIQKL